MQAQSPDAAQAIARFRVALEKRNDAIIPSQQGGGCRWVCAAQRLRLMQACMTKVKYHGMR